MTLQLDEDLSRLLESGDQPAEAAAREFIVLELYRRRRISSGKAAELLGEGKQEFLERADHAGIPYFDFTAEEWARELEAVEQITREHRL